MLVFSTIAADSPAVITGNILGLKFVVTQTQLAYWLFAALIGFIAEVLVGWRLPFGFLGAFIAAAIGIWITTSAIHLSIRPDPEIFGVPIYKTFIGSVIAVSIWHLLTFRSWKRPPRRRFI